VQYKWLRNQNRGIELEGKTAGVIGYGNTGSEMGKLLSAFGMNVLVYDKYRAFESIGTIKASSLHEIMEEANVISLHLPYTPETHHLVNDDFFRALKHSPVLINTSRGSIVNTSSLLHALDSGMISGAGLDVLENEKPSSFNAEERVIFDRLMQHAQVIVTPHIAGYTLESPQKMARVILEKLGLEV
jgi:D-3-phosphoglycerate dehydrogenase